MSELSHDERRMAWRHWMRWHGLYVELESYEGIDIDASVAVDEAVLFQRNRILRVLTVPQYLVVRAEQDAPGIAMMEEALESERVAVRAYIAELRESIGEGDQRD